MTRRVMSPAGGWVDAGTAPDEYLRYSARQQINAWRDDQRDAGFEALGHRWDSDSDSRDNLTAVVIAGQGSPTGSWTSADDADVAVTAQDMAVIYGAMLVRGGQIHARQRAMKLAVESMTRAELLEFVPGWV
jgi:hypothetical protein